MNDLTYLPMMTHCAFCQAPVEPQDAVWDEETDEAYCCADHREEDRLIRLTQVWDWEDSLYSEAGLS